jgi:acid phosphatase type 7
MELKLEYIVRPFLMLLIFCAILEYNRNSDPVSSIASPQQAYQLLSIHDLSLNLTSTVYLTDPQTCTLYSPAHPPVSCENSFPQGSIHSSQQFTIQSLAENKAFKASPRYSTKFKPYKTSTSSYLYHSQRDLRSAFSHVDVVAEPITVPNISEIRSGFNFPINEAGPNSYFWHLLPQQIHLSWTENPGEMRIMWVTYINLDPKLYYRSLVCKDEAPGNWTSLLSTTTLFNEGKRMIHNQYIHTVIVPNLNPQCFYEYILGSACFWSPPYTFSGRTPSLSLPTVSDRSQPLKMIVIGDWGPGILGSYTEELLEQELKVHEMDGLVHVGDMGYDLDEEEGTYGDKWLNLIQPVAATLAYMVLPGNHEAGRNFSHYMNRFKMPRNQENQGTNLFYSFNIGLAHFIMFSTEQYFYEELGPVIENGIKWLVRDLEMVKENREKVPWVFFLTHRPFYCSTIGKGCFKEAEMLRGVFEELFNEFSVDVVFQGHIHNYERYRIMYRNQSYIEPEDTFHTYVKPKHPLYIVNGNAGNHWAHNNPIREDPTEDLMIYSEDYGYGRLMIYNESCLYYEQFSSESSSIIDYFYILK